MSGRTERVFDRGPTLGPAPDGPLTPLGFLRRAAALHPDKPAVIHGETIRTYRDFWIRVRSLASALRRRGIQRGDRVAILAPNVPALLEAHYGVPLAGAVLNALNVRLDAASIGFILKHGGAKLLLADAEFAGTVRRALGALDSPPPVVRIDDPVAALSDDADPDFGAIEYEMLLAEGDPQADYDEPEDEWQSICLLYTSGTTGNPKGVLYHHRGACLNALGNMTALGLVPESVYLWTLPMFHCSGWSHTWAVTAACATHVCLRRVEPAAIFELIARHGVTHLSGAPIVLNLLAQAPDSVKVSFGHRVEVATGGAAPPSVVLEALERDGFRVTHLYGLTESFGPATICAWQEGWGTLPLEQRSALLARQGVRYPTLDEIRVADPETLEERPRDGLSIGEILLRGNTVMKGYLDNPEATAEAFRGEWFHSGDLAVRHADGYLEIKDRAKDIIISGGENISSLEVEEVLYRHPRVLEAAVVAMPDAKWGETPCAFVTLRDSTNASAQEIIGFCRDRLAHFKAPTRVVFGPLPKTATGKIQKFTLRDAARELAS